MVHRYRWHINLSPLLFFKRRLSDVQFAYLLIMPLIVFVILMVIYPLAYSLWLSLQKVDIRFNLYEFTGFLNYRKAFTDMRFGSALRVTLLFTTQVVAITMLLGLGAALLLNETFKGRGMIRSIFLLPWAVSEYSTAILTRYMFSQQIGLINGILYILGFISENINFFTAEGALTVLALMYSWRLAPLGAFFFLAGLQTVPQDLYNAAKIDGMGRFWRFVEVTLPHIRYSLIIVLVMNTLYAAAAADILIVATGGGPGIATQALSLLSFKETFLNLNLGYGSAISYILLIIMMTLGVTYFALLMRRRR